MGYRLLVLADHTLLHNAVGSVERPRAMSSTHRKTTICQSSLSGRRSTSRAAAKGSAPGQVGVGSTNFDQHRAPFRRRM